MFLISLELTDSLETHIIVRGKKHWSSEFLHSKGPLNIERNARNFCIPQLWKVTKSRGHCETARFGPNLLGVSSSRLSVESVTPECCHLRAVGAHGHTGSDESQPTTALRSVID